MKGVFLSSIACLLMPLIITSYNLRGRKVVSPSNIDKSNGYETTPFVQKLMFFMGMGTLVAIPIFKSITHLAPFMGILFGLGMLWVVGEILHRKEPDAEFKDYLSLVSALKRIDMSCVLFFIGILFAVATLEHTHILGSLAEWLSKVLGRDDIIVTLIGLASAVVDNVPLVAASMGMYNMAQYPPDSFLWEFIAYCAGTGGSILIIGSAAGVAAMGLEKIHFFWYARKIGILAAFGYFAGIFAYIIQYKLLH
jgi:Na+/H+ antiporter NhaD/arsenite permease-like protein